MNRLHIFVPAALESLLRKESEKTGLSMSEIIRNALQLYFNKR